MYSRTPRYGRYSGIIRPSRTRAMFLRHFLSWVFWRNISSFFACLAVSRQPFCFCRSNGRMAVMCVTCTSPLLTVRAAGRCCYHGAGSCWWEPQGVVVYPQNSWFALFTASCIPQIAVHRTAAKTKQKQVTHGVIIVVMITIISTPYNRK